MRITESFLYLMSACAVFLAASEPAFAAGFDLFIDPSFGSTENTGSTSLVRFEFSEDQTTDVLTLTFTNTTPLSIGSRLTAVGLEVPKWLIDPLSATLIVTDDYFDTLTFDANVSPGWLDAPGGYDWMITAESEFLGGSPRGAPLAGESASVVLNLGNTALSPADLAIGFRLFYTSQTNRSVIGRFQSVGPNVELSDKVSGGVPEPGTLVLLCLGAVAFIRPSRSR